MKLSNIKEGLVVGLGLAVVSGMVWAGTELVRLGGKVDSVEGRVERIADALPGIGAQIAFEGMLDPFRTALLVGEPYLKAGIWYSDAFVLDAMLHKRIAYTVALESENDMAPYHRLYGQMFAAGIKPATTVALMENWSHSLQREFYWPPELLKGVSSLSRIEPTVLQNAMVNVGFHEVDTKVVEFGNTWDGLSAALKKHPALYTAD